MKRKWLVLSLLLVVVLAIAAACGRGNDEPRNPAPEETSPPAQDTTGQQDPAAQEDTIEEAPVERELIRVSVSNWGVSGSFADSGEPCEIYAYIQERFGLTFDPINVGWDNFWELPHLWAAADTLPDIIGALNLVNHPAMREWADVGMIRALPEDLSRWPDLNRVISQQFVQDYAINGRTYFVPRMSAPSAEYQALARGIINRRDWREQLGIPVPQTPEDFLDMWRAYTENDMNGDGSMVFGVMPNAPFLMHEQALPGFGDTRPGWVMLDDGSMVRLAMERTSIPLLSFWRTAFNQGLVDPDFITQDNLAHQHFALGRVGTILHHIQPVHLNNLYSQWVELQPDVDFFDAVEILFTPRLPGITPLYDRGAGFWSETMFSSRVDDATMERILDFFDWGSSEAGVNMMVFGIEGQDFVIENGEIVMLTPIDPDTGQHLGAGDIHLFASGGMNNLIAWSHDLVEWTNPNIPLQIRQMSMAARDYIFGPTNDFVTRDNRIGTLEVPEADELGISTSAEWVAMVTDTRDISDEELFEEFYARWTAQGYGRAKEAMTRAMAARLAE